MVAQTWALVLDLSLLFPEHHRTLLAIRLDSSICTPFQQPLIGHNGREGVSQGGLPKEATSFHFVSLVFCCFGIPYEQLTRISIDDEAA